MNILEDLKTFFEKSVSDYLHPITSSIASFVTLPHLSMERSLLGVDIVQPPPLFHSWHIICAQISV